MVRDYMSGKIPFIVGSEWVRFYYDSVSPFYILSFSIPELRTVVNSRDFHSDNYFHMIEQLVADDLVKE